MRKEDRVRLQHMLIAAREAVSFTQGKSRNDFQDDRVLVLAIVRSVEIIGEAASKVDPEIRDKLPEIPWSMIVAMRNRLIHAYYDVDLDRVWDTVALDLPPLIRILDGFLADDPGVG